MGSGLEKIIKPYKKSYANNPVITLLILFLTLALAIDFILFFIPGLNAFSNILHENHNDVFMDFFNSVVYSMDNPYTKYQVIYPPLTTLVYGLIGNATIGYVDFSSSPTGSLCFRNSQECMMVFALITLVTLFIFHIYFQNATDSLNKWQVNLLFFLTLFSAPVIYSIDRGNNILICVIFCLSFLQGYSSDNKWIRYLSYVALAFAVGIKIYPIFLILLVLRERKYWEFVLCLTAIILIFVGPFIFTDGDLTTLMRNILNFASNSPSDLKGQLVGMIRWVLIAISVPFAIIATLYCKRIPFWQLLFLITAAMMACAGINIIYVFCFVLIPFLYFIKQENELTKKNLIVIICIVGMFLLYPQFSIVQAVSILILEIVLIYYSIKTEKKHQVNEKMGIIQ